MRIVLWKVLFLEWGLVIVKFKATIIIVIFHIVCQNNGKTIFYFNSFESAYIHCVLHNIWNVLNRYEGEEIENGLCISKYRRLEGIV